VSGFSLAEQESAERCVEKGDSQGQTTAARRRGCRINKKQRAGRARRLAVARCHVQETFVGSSISEINLSMCEFFFFEERRVPFHPGTLHFQASNVAGEAVSTTPTGTYNMIHET
jgi:hypothetical protein